MVPSFWVKSSFRERAFFLVHAGQDGAVGVAQGGTLFIHVVQGGFRAVTACHFFLRITCYMFGFFVPVYDGPVRSDQVNAKRGQFRQSAKIRCFDQCTNPLLSLFVGVRPLL